MSPSGAPSKPPANAFVVLVRKLYHPLGFTRGYNFSLFVLTAGAMAGFALARLMYLDLDGVFCNQRHAQRSLPGECYWYQSGRAGHVGILLHLAGVLPAGLLACLQFVPVVRRRALLFHRLNGYLVLLLSAVGVIGVFMIARRAFGGGVHMQTVMGAGSVVFVGALGLAYYNIKKLQIEQHRAWMLRAWVYAGFIITMRMISYFAAVITSGGEYYEAKECAVLDFIFDHNETRTLALYPGCGPFYSDEDPGLKVLVHADIRARQPAEIAAAYTSVAAAGSWLALAIHAILVELYLHLTPAETERLRRISYRRQLETGMKEKEAGNAGLTVQRVGDAEPWLPPPPSQDIQRPDSDDSNNVRTPNSDEEVRIKSASEA